MPLALHPNPASAPARRKTDHLVMNGQLEVGRIYKRDTPNKSDSQWLWAINGVPLAAANLQEIGGSVPLQPASTPVVSEDIGGSVPLQPVSTPVASEDIGGSVP